MFYALPPPGFIDSRFLLVDVISSAGAYYAQPCFHYLAIVGSRISGP